MDGNNIVIFTTSGEKTIFQREESLCQEQATLQREAASGAATFPTNATNFIRVGFFHSRKRNGGSFRFFPTGKPTSHRVSTSFD